MHPLRQPFRATVKLFLRHRGLDKFQGVGRTADDDDADENNDFVVFSTVSVLLFVFCVFLCFLCFSMFFSVFCVFSLFSLFFFVFLCSGNTPAPGAAGDGFGAPVNIFRV